MAAIKPQPDPNPAPQGRGDLSQEIEQLRLGLQRLAQLAGQLEDAGEMARVLSALSAASKRLADILLAQSGLGAGGDGDTALDQALKRMARKEGLLGGGPKTDGE